MRQNPDADQYAMDQTTECRHIRHPQRDAKHAGLYTTATQTYKHAGMLITQTGTYVRQNYIFFVRFQNSS